MKPHRVVPSCLAGWLALASGVLFAQDPVVPPGAEVKRLAGGFQFTEGPAWDRKDTLYFSDIPKQTIYAWSEVKGALPFKKLEGSCNGLWFDKNGELLVCQPTGRAVLRLTAEDKLQVTNKDKEVVLADSYQGKKLNSPNDLWMDPKGGLYFTDPRYGQMDDLEQDGFHVYYLPPKEAGGSLRRILSDLKKPNGVVGTADGKRLFVADPGANVTYVYEIKEDGSLSNRRVAAPAGSDGLTVDDRGNLYITGKTIRIYSPEAKVVGEIELPEVASNLTFGGPEGKTLFITARTSLYAVTLNVKGGSDPFAKKNEDDKR